MTDLDRRRFLQVSITAAGGMMLSLHLPPVVANTNAGSAAGSVEVGAWLVIDPDNTVTIRVAQSEMGQGVLTSLAMIIAEELEVDWRQVRAEYADVNRHLRGGRVYGRMLTGGSSAVRHSMPYLRMAGAEARERLIKAAAESWNLAPDECYADYGRVVHRATNRSVAYGEIAAAAAQVSVAGVEIKSPRDFDLLGLPTPRLDVPSKVDGSAHYSMDVRLPGMVYAAVVHCPVIGGRLLSYRFNVVRNRPGVRQAVRLDHGVAVIADTWWQAHQAAEAMPVEWEVGDEEDFYSATEQRNFVAALDEPGIVVVNDGDAESVMDEAEKSIESDYSVPYLAHACMEPLNCTVVVHADHAEAWVGTQDPEAAVAAVAEVAGLDAAQVTLHNYLLGGGFGRRAHTDYVREATMIAQAYRGVPVQMIWSREEDSRSGRYRPMAAVRFKAGFDLGGKLIAYINHSVTHSIQQDSGGSGIVGGVDPFSIDGLTDMPYYVPNKRISHRIRNTHLTSWFWRSVGHSQNAFAMECFVDEMASAAGTDPVAFRRQYLAGRPKLREVLAELAEKARWGRAMPHGSAQGLALHESFGTICGQVAEVTVSEQGQLSVDRIVTVVDCGNLVNPMTARQQIESGIVFGLTAALYGKLTFEDGELVETNFDQYRMIKLRDMPELDTHFSLSRGDEWGGLGEPGTPPVAAAVCNALFKITKRRIRALPIADYYLRRA